MGNSNLLFESIFKRKLSADDTREFLIKITNDHPYFSTAQFFLLLKTGKGTPGYRKQAAKTSVLFNNPYWLQFQLWEKEQTVDGISDDNFGDDNKFVPAGSRESHLPEPAEINETFTVNETGNVNPDGPEIIEGGEQALPNEMPASSQNDETAIDFDKGKEKAEFIDQPGPLYPGEITEEQAPENISEPVKSENEISAQVKEDGGTIAENEILPVAGEEPVFSLPGKDGIVTAEGTDEAHNNNKRADSMVPENEDEKTDTLHYGHFNNENSPLVNETESDDELVTEDETEPLNFKLNIDTTNTTEENITFEPLHTSDYFASLGIKLSNEIKPNDKLGKQLRSFTEWLKTMKKIHTDQLQPLSSEADISIQKLAEQSNKEDAVVTEAMADVLLQQGKTDKAIEVYKKLSLLNPSKSTYFAAKIDQLKEN